MRRVAILVETSRAYGRGLLRGIGRYIQEHGHWSPAFEPQGLGDRPPPWLATWQGHGILARIENRSLAAAVVQSGLPAVNLRGTLESLPLPFIGSDNEAVARLAATHLLDRGFHHFGFCGFPRGFHPGYDRRGDSFQRLIEQAGHACRVFPHSARKRPRSWEREQMLLAGWIAELPKPVGILAANDDRGMRLLDACRRADVDVPQQVAVLGVDNDEFLCGLGVPPLSSIDINSEETGYRAAALLDRMMDGKQPPARPVATAPLGVVARRSTDVLATDDHDVIAAVQFIREHACRPIGVTEVLGHLSVSRSTLEPRFGRVLGRTIHQEIERVRIERAKALLTGTGLPIKQIAKQIGFKSVQYFTRAFHRVSGSTPAVFRRQLQVRMADSTFTGVEGRKLR